MSITVCLRKPAGIFDRDEDCAALAAFAPDTCAGARLGVVRGRRRHGEVGGAACPRGARAQLAPARAALLTGPPSASNTYSSRYPVSQVRARPAT